MSVQRGLFLQRLLAVLPKKTSNSHSLTILLSLVCVLGVIAVSTGSILSSLAARRSQAEKSINTNQTSKTNRASMTYGGAMAPTCSAAFAALQGCTLNCSATVPASAAAGASVSFTGSATPSGCGAATPTYSWDFGDGTANSTQQSPSHTYTNPGTYTWSLTTSINTGLMIDTIVGGLGEGASSTQAPLGVPGLVARDPQGRGIYVVDANNDVSLIRFINTTNAPVTIAGRSIAPGAIRSIAGGGPDFSGDNVTGAQANLGDVTGLAVSSDGALVYFIDPAAAKVRAVNVSAGRLNVGSGGVDSGRVGTLATFAPVDLNGLATHPTNGEVYVISTTTNQVFRITSDGNMSVFAGSGASSSPNDPFSPGNASNVPLLQPRAIKFDSSGALYIADSGHGRVIRVSGGSASLVRQFTLTPQANGFINPYPSGLAIAGSDNAVYASLGNEHTIWRVTGSAARIAGAAPGSDGKGVPCAYPSAPGSISCGDGGNAINAGFTLLGSTGAPPIAGLEGDGNGLYVLDQAGNGRVRYINLTGGAVAVAGVNVEGSAVRTIAGSGLDSPYNNGPAISGDLSFPVGVAIDANGNLWVSDTNRSQLRFVNTGSTQVTIFGGTPAVQTVPAGGIVSVNYAAGPGAGGDDGPVHLAGFEKPQGLFATAQGIYVVDSLGGPLVPEKTGPRSGAVRFINTTGANVTLFSGAGGNAITVAPGTIKTVVGGGINDSTSGFATAVTLKGASDVAVAGNGTIYITEVNRKAVRKVDGSTGAVTAVNLPANKEYTGVGFTSDGRLLVANFTDGSVHRESGAGSGTFAVFGGTGGSLVSVRDVAGAADGSVYATTGPVSPITGNHRIVQISSAGTATPIAGGSPGFVGDGGSATGSQMNLAPSPLVLRAGGTQPIQTPETVNIIVGQNGEIIFTDTNNGRVRRISGISCVRTGTITITGQKAVPVLSSINPTSRQANSGQFTLTAIGSGFSTDSTVRWNGQDRPTTFVSVTELSATIPASDLAVTVTTNVQVTVFTPAPGGGTSAARTFTILGPNPVPTITSLSPNTKAAGSPAFTLTVNGTGFVSGMSVLRLDGSPRPTTVVSSTSLTAQIGEEDLIGDGDVIVTVLNPTPGGGTSNNFTFTVGPAMCTNPAQNPVPTVSATATESLSPTAILAGTPAFTLTVTGTNFVCSSVLRVNGQARTTKVLSTTKLTATITAADVAAAGNKPITVFNPTPSGGTSSAVNLNVLAAAQAFGTVNGAKFGTGPVTPGSIVAGFGGGGLASGFAAAAAVPLPTSLLETSVRVTDSQGTTRDASLFFVSGAQINYLLPDDMAEGLATTVVVNSTTGAPKAAGSMTVTKVEPAIFTANSFGTGVASALVLRATAANVQTYEGVALAGGTPIPISFGPAGDQIFLILYGTGFAKSTGDSNLGNGIAENVTVTVNGVPLTVGFAGSLGNGLGQINTGAVPRTLIGVGTVNVVVSVRDSPTGTFKPANTVTLTFQ